MMITFIKDILPKITRYSKKLDDLTILTNQHWVYVDKSSTSKMVFIFRSNSDLIVSVNGVVEKGKWTYLGNDYLLVEKPSESFLYKHGFFDDTVLALKVDGTADYAFFVNETKIGRELNSLDNVLSYLDDRYIRQVNPTPSPVVHHIFLEGIYPSLGDNGKWGYRNSNGDLLIPFKFEAAYRFVGDLAIVIFNSKYGMIDLLGNLAIPADYDFLEPFSEGLSVARVGNKFGYIDKQNKIRHPFIFDDADSFEKGKAKVILKGEANYLNNDF